MKTIILNAATTLPDAVSELQGNPLVVLDGTTPVAVLLPVENADLESISLSLNPQFLDIIQRSRLRLAKEGGISSEELRRQLGIPAAKKSAAKTTRRKRATADKNGVPAKKSQPKS